MSGDETKNKTIGLISTLLNTNNKQRLSQIVPSNLHAQDNNNTPSFELIPVQSRELNTEKNQKPNGFSLDHKLGQKLFQIEEDVKKESQDSHFPLQSQRQSQNQDKENNNESMGSPNKPQHSAGKKQTKLNGFLQKRKISKVNEFVTSFFKQVLNSDIKTIKLKSESDQIQFQGGTIKRIDRINHPNIQYPRFILPVQSKLRAKWEIFILLLVVYVSFITPIEIGFSVQVDPKEICLKYVKSINFIIDVLSSIPIGDMIDGSKKELRLIGLVKIIRLLRLSKLFDLLSSSKLKLYGQMFKILYIFITIIHWLVCIWFLQVQTDYDNTSSNLLQHQWVPLTFYSIYDDSERTQLFSQFYNQEDPNAKSLSFKYVYSFYAIYELILGQEISPTNIKQAALASVIAIIGQIAIGIVFGQMSYLIYKMNLKEQEYSDRLDKLEHFVLKNNLKDYTAQKIFDYFEFCWRKNVVFQFEMTDFSDLSKTLQNECSLVIHQKILNNIPLFQFLEIQELLAIVQKFKIYVYMPEDYIMRVGELNNALYFVKEGIIEKQDVLEYQYCKWKPKRKNKNHKKIFQPSTNSKIINLKEEEVIDIVNLSNSSPGEQHQEQSHDIKQLEQDYYLVKQNKNGLNNINDNSKLTLISKQNHQNQSLNISHFNEHLESLVPESNQQNQKPQDYIRQDTNDLNQHNQNNLHYGLRGSSIDDNLREDGDQQLKIKHGLINISKSMSFTQKKDSDQQQIQKENSEDPDLEEIEEEIDTSVYTKQITDKVLIKPGSHFGELSLLLQMAAKSDYQSISFSVLEVLEKQEFDNICQLYSGVKGRINQGLQTYKFGEKLFVQDTLQKSPYFDHLNNSKLNILYENYFYPLYLQPSQILYYPHQDVQSILCIMSGQLAICNDYNQMKHEFECIDDTIESIYQDDVIQLENKNLVKIIRKLGPGDCFGALNFDKKNYEIISKYYIVALTSCQIIQLRNYSIEIKLEAHAPIFNQLEINTQNTKIEPLDLIAKVIKNSNGIHQMVEDINQLSIDSYRNLSSDRPQENKSEATENIVNLKQIIQFNDIEERKISETSPLKQALNYQNNMQKTQQNQVKKSQEQDKKTFTQSSSQKRIKTIKSEASQFINTEEDQNATKILKEVIIQPQPQRIQIPVIPVLKIEKGEIQLLNSAKDQKLTQQQEQKKNIQEQQETSIQSDQQKEFLDFVKNIIMNQTIQLDNLRAKIEKEII